MDSDNNPAPVGLATDSIVLEEEIDPNYVPSEEEVVEYAKWLGMDLEKDTDLFWVAREGLMAPLPKNWKPCKTKDTEDIYYFNFASGESTWDHPCDGYYKSLYEEEKKKKEIATKERNDQQRSRAKQDVVELLGKEEKKKKKKKPFSSSLGELNVAKRSSAELGSGLPAVGAGGLERKPLPGIAAMALPKVSQSEPLLKPFIVPSHTGTAEAVQRMGSAPSPLFAATKDGSPVATTSGRGGGGGGGRVSDADRERARDQEPASARSRSRLTARLQSASASAMADATDHSDAHADADADLVLEFKPDQDDDDDDFDSKAGDHMKTASPFKVGNAASSRQRGLVAEEKDAPSSRSSRLLGSTRGNTHDDLLVDTGRNAPSSSSSTAASKTADRNNMSRYAATENATDSERKDVDYHQMMEARRREFDGEVSSLETSAQSRRLQLMREQHMDDADASPSEAPRRERDRDAVSSNSYSYSSSRGSGAGGRPVSEQDQDLRAALDRANEKISQLEKRGARLEDDLAAAERRAEREKENANIVRNEASATEEDFGKQLKAARDGRAAAEGERDKWRDECANVNRDLLALRIAAAPAASSGGGGGGSSGDSIETKLLRDKNASLESTIQGFERKWRTTLDSKLQLEQQLAAAEGGFSDRLRASEHARVVASGRANEAEAELVALRHRLSELQDHLKNVSQQQGGVNGDLDETEKLRGQLEEAQEQCREARAELDRLRSTGKSRDELLEQSRAEVTALRQRVGELSTNTAASAYSDGERETDFANRTKAYEEKINSLQAERQSLMSKAGAEVRAAEERLRAKATELQEATTAIDDLQHQRHMLEQRAELLEAEVKEKEGRCLQLRTSTLSLQTQSESLERELILLKKQTAADIEERNFTIASLKAQLDSLKAAASSAEAASDNQMSQHSKIMQETRAELAVVLAERDREKEAASAARQQLQSLQRELQSLEQQLLTVSSRLRERESQLEASSEQLTQLAQAHRNCPNQLEHSERLRRQAEQQALKSAEHASESLANKEKAIRSLAEQLADEQAANALKARELTAANDSLAQLRKQLAAAETSLLQQMTQNKALAQLQNAVSATASNPDELRAAPATAQASEQDRVEAELRKQLSAQIFLAIATTSERDALQRELNTSASKVNELKQAIASLQGENEGLSNKLRQIERLQKEKNDESVRQDNFALQSFKQQIDSAESDRTRLQSENTSLKLQLESLRADLILRDEEAAAKGPAPMSRASHADSELDKELLRAKLSSEARVRSLEATLSQRDAEVRLAREELSAERRESERVRAELARTQAQLAQARIDLRISDRGAAAPISMSNGTEPLPVARGTAAAADSSDPIERQQTDSAADYKAVGIAEIFELLSGQQKTVLRLESQLLSAEQRINLLTLQDKHAKEEPQVSAGRGSVAFAAADSDMGLGLGPDACSEAYQDTSETPDEKAERKNQQAEQQRGDGVDAGGAKHHRAAVKSLWTQLLRDRVPSRSATPSGASHKDRDRDRDREIHVDWMTWAARVAREQGRIDQMARALKDEKISLRREQERLNEQRDVWKQQKHASRSSHSNNPIEKSSLRLSSKSLNKATLRLNEQIDRLREIQEWINIRQSKVNLLRKQLDGFFSVSQSQSQRGRPSEAAAAPARSGRLSAAGLDTLEAIAKELDSDATSLSASALSLSPSLGSLLAHSPRYDWEYLPRLATSPITTRPQSRRGRQRARSGSPYHPSNREAVRADSDGVHRRSLDIDPSASTSTRPWHRPSHSLLHPPGTVLSKNTAEAAHFISKPTITDYDTLGLVSENDTETKLNSGSNAFVTDTGIIRKQLKEISNRQQREAKNYEEHTSWLHNLTKKVSGFGHSAADDVDARIRSKQKDLEQALYKL